MLSDFEEVEEETPKLPPGPSGMYKYGSVITEAPTTNDRQTTYGVQFVWKPCKEYLQGGGSFWKGRRILNADTSRADALRGNTSNAVRIGDDDDDDTANIANNVGTTGGKPGANDHDNENVNGDEKTGSSDGEKNPRDHLESNGNRPGSLSHAVDAYIDIDDDDDDDDGDDPGPDVDVDVDVEADVGANPDCPDDPMPQRRLRGVSRSTGLKADGNNWRHLFVTCNSNAVRIYEARRGHRPYCLQRYEDDDATEVFYCVGWTYNADGNHEWWACAAGRKGIVRIVDVQTATLKMSLTGHGEAVNDLKFHPKDPSLILTASKDESLRLWNLRTGVTIAVFAGLKGHRGEVVYADFNHDGSRFASCGIDNSVRIWDVYDDDKVVNAIKDSHHVADLGVNDPYIYTDESGTRRKTKVVMSQFPYFVTRKVHKHYVDCVMWVGDLLLSKSVHNRMFLWEPESDRESLASPACNYSLLEEYVLDVCNVWFIRFSMDRMRRLVACGNDKVRF